MTRHKAWVKVFLAVLLLTAALGNFYLAHVLIRDYGPGLFPLVCLGAAALFVLGAIALLFPRVAIRIGRFVSWLIEWIP